MDDVIKLVSRILMSAVFIVYGYFKFADVTTRHPFWTMKGAARASNQLNFYKNIAIMAAYMLLAIGGPGRYSLDNRRV